MAAGRPPRNVPTASRCDFRASQPPSTPVGGMRARFLTGTSWCRLDMDDIPV